MHISMLLNSRDFGAVVEAAQAKAAGNAYALRAIARAIHELNRSPYWNFDSATGVLKIKSSTSGKDYVVTDSCQCASKTVCKHRYARRLLACYAERLAAAQAEEVTLQRATVETVQPVDVVTVKAYPALSREACQGRRGSYRGISWREWGARENARRAA